MVSTWRFLILLGYFIVFGNAECPRIASRGEWGGRPPVNSPEEMNLPVPFAVVHHGGIKKYCIAMRECAAIARSYQNYHIDGRGWNDIGYNFLVGEDGNVYEGRGWAAVGAHAPTYNTKSIGICIMGDFTDRLPNAIALNAVRQLIDCGVAQQKIEPHYQLIGHRQNTASQTECPGNRLFQEITSWPHWTPDPNSSREQNPGSEPEDHRAPGGTATTSTSTVNLLVSCALTAMAMWKQRV